MTANFTTSDRLNTPEPEPTQEEVLAEAFRIVRGQTMMLATKAHLVALAELSRELLKALRSASELLFEIERLKDATLVANNEEIIDQIEAAITKAKKVSHA